MDLADQSAQHGAGTHLNIRCDAFRRKARDDGLPAHGTRDLADEGLERLEDAVQRLQLLDDLLGLLLVVPEAGAFHLLAELIATGLLVAQVKESLEGRADTIAQDEFTKSSEKAKKYDYFEASNVLKVLQKKLGGIQKWDDMIKQRDDGLKRQKDLHEKFVTAVNEKLKAGAVEINGEKHKDLLLKDVPAELIIQVGKHWRKVLVR